MTPQNDKHWQLEFDPRAANGDEVTCYDVGARWDRLNLKESVKAGAFYEGLVFRNVVTGTVLISVKSAKTGQLILHEVDYKRDWLAEPEVEVESEGA